MEIGYHGPYLSTEGGSRLAFAPEGFGLNYLCRFGSLSLRPTDIARVQFTGRGAICHRVQLINGSLLAGIIRDSAIRVDLRLGRTVSIDRHELTALSFADQLDVNPFLTRIELTNDDVLLGKLTDKSFPLRSAFGELSLSPRTIKEMTFAGKHAGAALITTWEGTELRGVLARNTIPLQLTENLSVDVAASLCRSVARAQPLPPDQVLASAKEALAKVRSVADFDARVGELRRVGVGLVPLVENKLRGPMDPTLRRRYRELISELKGEEVNRANAPEMMFWGGPLVVPKQGFIAR
jgi:hypothetical protein